MPAADAGAPAGPPVFRPLDALARFAVGSPTAAAVRAELAKAAKQGGTTRVPKWGLYPDYVKVAAVAKAVDTARDALEGSNDAAVAVYQLKQVLKGGDSIPAKFYLAEAYRRLKRFDEAEALFLAVVKADAGRTELPPGR
jgi:tetratricopeptide (TPR) repeat protein